MRGALPQFVARRLDPEKRYGVRLTLFAAAVVLVAIPFSTLMFQVLGEGPLTRIDGSVADGLNDAVHRSALLVDAITVVTFFGTTLWLAVAVIAAVVILGRRGWWRLAVFLVVTSLGGGIVNASVKAAVDRPRPVVDHAVATAGGKSFQSGHAMSSTVVYGALLLVFLPVVQRRRRPVTVVVAVVVVLAIGSSRLLLGVHFLTDVLGGYVLGMAWLALSTAAFQIWRVERGERPRRPVSKARLRRLTSLRAETAAPKGLVRRSPRSGDSARHQPPTEPLAEGLRA